MEHGDGMEATTSFSVPGQGVLENHMENDMKARIPLWFLRIPILLRHDYKIRGSGSQVTFRKAPLSGEKP